MNYQAPLEEFNFLLNTFFDIKSSSYEQVFKNLDSEIISTILNEGKRLSEEVLAPINQVGDLKPAKLNGTNVECPPGFIEAYRAIKDGGWIGISGDPQFGGMGLPITLTTCLNEMMSSACLSLALNPLMTQGQIEALENYACEEIKALYLPKLNSGTWTGTMNLTEPHAGSDVGSLSTKAEPLVDGTFEIYGQKIYISWGDHDLAENICHLVLARLPGCPKGVKGISLFIVPKFIPDQEGNLGSMNKLKPISLEKKMGLHGSPTAVMQYDGAKGWLIGKKNEGMAAMFTMMNNARLGVGVQGLSQCERATQTATRFATGRIQGKSPVIDEKTEGIIQHADVRRNLMTMRVLTTVCRYICFDTALSLDKNKFGGDTKSAARAAFLIPIAKSFSTECGCKVSEIGIQVHGGMGYIEDTGVSQFYRDVRVTAIYEGTNGIQAIDLVTRKLADNGKVAKSLLLEIREVEEQAGSELQDLANKVSEVRHEVSKSLEWILNTSEVNDRLAGATPFLRAFSLLLGAKYLLREAIISDNQDRLALSKFYINQILPQAKAEANAARQNAGELYDYKFEEYFE